MDFSEDVITQTLVFFKFATGSTTGAEELCFLR